MTKRMIFRYVRTVTFKCDMTDFMRQTNIYQYVNDISILARMLSVESMTNISSSKM